MGNISNSTLLFIVLGAGVLAILYMTLKDMIRKPEATPAPGENASKPAVDKSILPLQLQAYERLVLHDCVATHLISARAVIEKGDRSGSRKLIDQFWLPNRTWDSLARDAANTADVAAHMPHERMLQYRIAYEMVPATQRLAEKELGDLGRFRALPASGGPLTGEEKLSEIGAIEALKIDNDTFARESRFLLLRMKMMNLRLSKHFVERRVRAARAHYGDCVSAPRIGSNSLGQTVLD